MNNIIEINNLNKSYLTISGKIKTLDNINLTIKEKEIISIIGPSGSGKSTLLNILCGIDDSYEGSIKISDSYGYMTQQDALLPWLNVLDNTMLANKFNYSVDKSYVINLLKKYNLYDFINKKPNSLSGGMKQRVALIRTLATNPKILFLDEPFSALDYQNRLLIENDLYNIIKKENKTLIMVTHDIESAISLSDKVIVLSKRPGRIKNIYNININEDNPIKRRSNDKFNYYFNLIWKDIDING